MQEDVNSIRLMLFLAAFVSLFVAERVWPRKIVFVRRYQRWMTNILLIVVSTGLIKGVLSVAGSIYTSVNTAGNIGFFNIYQPPVEISILWIIVIMDFCIYWQHRLFHLIPLFWRFHRVHHADNDIDITTGVRFHPLEMILSALIKACILVALGAPIWAALIFEMLLSTSSLFTHANVKLNTHVDRMLRWIIVTPDMHRIHHSVSPEETNSNYGFFLSLWDRLFSSYIPSPKGGQEKMRIGLKEYQSSETSSLWWSLKLPFTK